MANKNSTPKADGTATTGVNEMATRAKGKPAADGAAAGITKMEAMRRALGTLSRGAKNSQIQQYIKEQFGYEMSPAMISTYKNHIRKKARTGRKRGRPVGSTGIRGASTTGIHVDDIRAVQELAGRLGAGKLRSLVDVLCK